MGLYFSGNESLSGIIAPFVEGISGDSYREFGLLENLQNIYLIVCIILAAKATKIYTIKWQKTLMYIAVLGFTFLFLEEIDYGRHIYDYLVKPTHMAVDRNIHNIDGFNRVFKLTADVMTTLWFILLPFIYRNVNSDFKNNFVPHKWYVITLVLMVTQSKLNKYLFSQGFGPDPDYLLGNVSEFKELWLYYVWMIYMIDIVIWRTGKKKSVST